MEIQRIKNKVSESIAEGHNMLTKTVWNYSSIKKGKQHNGIEQRLQKQTRIHTLCNLQVKFHCRTLGKYCFFFFK